MSLSHGGGPLGVKHFYEQIVARHFSAQVLVAQEVLGLRAERPDLRQPQYELTEAVQTLRVRVERVLEQSAVHLLLHALHVLLVLQELHICRPETNHHTSQRLHSPCKSWCSILIYCSDMIFLFILWLFQLLF